MNLDAIIIGGGVSGLATAYYLRQAGRKVMVLERQNQTGGTAVSERRDGFLMEHGPSTMNAHVPVAEEISHALGLSDRQCDLGEGIRRRYLVSKGKLAAISMSPTGFLTSNYLSAGARMRMLAEFILPHKSDGEDETVHGFCTRRFGREFADRVLDPMVAGIYGGRASELSVASIFPKLAGLESKYGSVTLGMMHRRREGGKMPGSRLFSWQDGMATLPNALSRHLVDTIRTGVTVRRISRTAGGFRVQLGSDGEVQAKSVIIATQAHVAAHMLADIDPQGASAAAQIQAPPLAVVFLGYRRESIEHPLDGLGFLTSESENRSILGAQFCSTMFPGRAPAGHVAISAYIGGARAPELARLKAADLIALVRTEFRDLLGARSEPVVARVRHWPVGLPQYRVRHRDLLADLASTAARQPGLFLTGNYFAGPSVAICLSTAQKIAAEADAYLLPDAKATPRSTATL